MKEIFKMAASSMALAFGLAVAAEAAVVADIDFENSAYTIGSPIPATDTISSPNLVWSTLTTIGGGSPDGRWDIVASTAGAGTKGLESVTVGGAGRIEVEESSALPTAFGAAANAGWAEFWWKDMTPQIERGRWIFSFHNNATGLGDSGQYVSRRYGAVEGIKDFTLTTGTFSFKNLTTAGQIHTYDVGTEYYIQIEWDATVTPKEFTVNAAVEDPNGVADFPPNLIALPATRIPNDPLVTDISVRTIGFISELNGTQKAGIQIGRLLVGTGTPPTPPGQTPPAPGPNRASQWEAYD